MSKLPALLIGLMIVGALARPAPTFAAAMTVASPAGPLQSRDGRNRRVRIHNQTGWTIVRFQVADSQTRAWQDDVAAQPVTSGASWVATIDDGSGSCLYLFRAEFSNGQSLERGAVNVCEIADYYFTR